MKNTVGKHLKRYALAYGIAILAMIFSVCLDLVSPQISLHIVDDVIVGRDFTNLNWLLLGLLGIGVGRMIFQYVKEFLFDKSGVSVAMRMRRELFVHIQGLDTSFFEKTGTGEVMSRLKDDINNIWDALSYVIMLIIEVVLHTVIILYFMVKLNPWVTIIPVVAMGLCAFIAIKLEKDLDKVYDDISEENAKLTNIAEENITGVRTVKAFAREKYEIEKFQKHNKEYCDLNIKEVKVWLKYDPYLHMITQTLPFLVLIAAGYLYIEGKMTLGEVTAFVGYSNNIVWPMEMVAWLANSLSSATASNKKILKIYDEKPTIVDPEVPEVIDKVKGHITFDNVSFHKADNVDILSNISFDLGAGKTLGIMGATGAGKSTVISLLTRLYDVTDGKVMLDGKDIRDITLKQLRSSLSLVSQDVFLFSDTIAENIKMGNRKGLSEKVMKDSAKKAGASEFIEKMEMGYDTVIGEKGVGLSGGQKQRVSMARAFSKERPVLILDDSTSALDMETEHYVQNQLKELTDTTKIIIAHRISSVREADEIIFLEKGKIAERGTHEELLNKHGLYYETYVSQYGEPKDFNIA